MYRYCIDKSTNFQFSFSDREKYVQVLYRLIETRPSFYWFGRSLDDSRQYMAGALQQEKLPAAGASCVFGNLRLREP
jgi:hypothetical protein